MRTKERIGWTCWVLGMVSIIIPGILGNVIFCIFMFAAIGFFFSDGRDDFNGIS